MSKKEKVIGVNTIILLSGQPFDANNAALNECHREIGRGNSAFTMTFNEEASISREWHDIGKDTLLFRNANYLKNVVLEIQLETRGMSTNNRHCDLFKSSYGSIF